MDKKISIIVPTYNERNNITPLVERLHRALSGYSFEIVFIDDNSSDGTAEMAESLAAKYPVKVLVRRDEKGLASAVVHGLKHTDSEYLVVMDADLQHPPEIIPAILQELDAGADVAVASRYIRGGSCGNWGAKRKLISRGAIFLAHLLLPATRRIGDPMSGCFSLRREVIAGVELKPSGYKILLEILMMGRYRQVSEVPYTFANRSGGESKLSSRQQIDYLKHLYSLMQRRGELLRFFKFLVVGGSGVVVNLGVYSLITRFLYLNRFAALAISFEASVISNFLFNNYFTFSDRRAGKPLPVLIQFLKFNLVSLAGLGIQEGTLWLLNSVFNVNDIVSVFIGIILATLWNYLLNIWWTWQ